MVDAVRAEGVPCLHGGCSEIYRERAFATVPGTPEELPVAALLGRTSVMLLVHPTLTKSDVEDTAAALTKVLRVATA